MELYSIADFICCRKSCFFCEAPLNSRLSNFMGLDDDGLPLLNSPIKDGKISFHIAHTIPSFSVEADGVIDIRTNILSLTPKNRNTITPTIDDFLAKQSFLELEPHIRLFCSGKDCPHDYTAASNTFTVNKIRQGYWKISTCYLYYESFVIGHLWIQNNYFFNKVYIHSIDKPDIDPLVFPIMDLKTMGKTKVLNRIKTLVTFS
jgi:hypothetical protein